MSQKKAMKTDTITAKQDQELMRTSTPFDDRANMRFSISDLDLGLIRTYLSKIDRELFDSCIYMPFEDLLIKLNFADKVQDKYYPKNVALMFFNDEPDKFFPQTQIDIVQRVNIYGKEDYKEISFKGTLDKMFSDTMSYFESLYLMERVQKMPGLACANRFFSYPKKAIEEALLNALCHRSYEIPKPIEISVLRDKITIKSYPGPDSSITDEQIKELNFTAGIKRNQRIYDILKDPDPLEDILSGMEKIIDACEGNGSPLPIVRTDADRSFFLIELMLHKQWYELNAGQLFDNIE